MSLFGALRDEQYTTPGFTPLDSKTVTDWIDKYARAEREAEK